ncbi:elongator complex protein 2 [Nematocida sp. AWRm80]|nr:elongator complex protein 2 [Nematocida sp. AWRm80]
MHPERELKKTNRQKDVPGSRLIRSYWAAGCTDRVSNTSCLNNDTIYYTCGNTVISSGNIYHTPDITDNISALHVDDQIIAVGSYSGEVSVSIYQKEIFKQSNTPTPILSIFYFEGIVIYTTSQEIYVNYLDRSQSWSMPTKHVIMKTKVLRINRRVYTVFSTYDGHILIGAIIQEKDRTQKPGTVTSRLEILYESISYKEQIMKIDVAEIEETIKIVAGLSTGKVGIFVYDTKDQTFKKQEMIRVHRQACLSVEWTNPECTSFITSSEDGTATIWTHASHWECTQRLGTPGGPSLTNAFQAKDKVYLQVELGGIYQAFPKVQSLVSGHTKEITSLDILDDLIMTCSEDKTVRIFQLKNNQLQEVFRPLTGGHALSSAVFLNKHTIAVTGEENILRIYNSTQLYRTAVLGEDSDTNIPFTAVQQELSLTNLPHTPEPEEQEHILSGMQMEIGLSSNPFYETHKIYGFPFEIRYTRAIKDKMILSCCKSSQQSFSALFVLNTSFDIIQKIESHTLNIKQILVSPSEDLVATIGRDRRVSLYKRLDGIEHFPEEERLKDFQPTDSGLKLLDSRIDHKREIHSLSFSPDSTILYTSSKDTTIISYTTQNNKLDHLATTTTQTEITSLACLPISTNQPNQPNYCLVQGSISGMVTCSLFSLWLHNSPILYMSFIKYSDILYLVSVTRTGILHLCPIFY